MPITVRDMIVERIAQHEVYQNNVRTAYPDVLKPGMPVTVVMSAYICSVSEVCFLQTVLQQLALESSQ